MEKLESSYISAFGGLRIEKEKKPKSFFVYFIEYLFYAIQRSEMFEVNSAS